MKRTFVILIVFCLLLLPFPAVEAATDTIKLSSSGNLASTLDSVKDGGTIQIDGTFTIPDNFTWSEHGKTVTITGGTLDFSKLTEIILGDGIEFENITLKFADDSTLYANGKHLLISESVTVTGKITVYGGGKYSTPSSTDMTLLSGTYTNIFGGSYFGGVGGDVNLTVGGNVNADLTELTHEHTNCVYGGCNSGTVSGQVHLTFSGNAKANYAFGGALGSASRVKGGIHFLFTGGQVMGICGGSRDADHKGDVYLTVTGGSAEQIFGACEHAALTGNVYVNVLGGTISRRIYGGCYNEVSSSGKWSTANYVTGQIILTIGQAADITFSSSDSDRSLYAHSRQKTLSDKEDSHLVFADSVAHNKYKDKVGAQDYIMKIFMAGVNAADSTHYFSYSASGNTITQNCSYHSVMGSLTLSAGDAVYTGKPIQSAQITLSSSWIGPAPDITYENNTNAGTATATATVGNVSVNTSFTIANASQSTPAVTAVHETIYGKADGMINGLTVQMQVSTDGDTYSQVTDPGMTFKPGTYYVHFPARENYNASSPTKVTIEAGRMLKVTFRAEGASDIVREVAWNGSLTDIPPVPAKAGVDPSQSVWSITNFKNIQTDLIVNAVYSPSTCTVSYIADGKVIAEQTVVHGTDAAAPSVPSKSGYTGIWDHNGKNITQDTTITAIYTPVGSTATQTAGTTLPEGSEADTEPEDSTTGTTETVPDLTGTPVTTPTQQPLQDPTDSGDTSSSLALLILIPLLLIIAGGICVLVPYKKRKEKS